MNCQQTIHKLSAKQTIHMKCQALFSLKSKKKKKKKKKKRKEIEIRLSFAIDFLGASCTAHLVYVERVPFR